MTNVQRDSEGKFQELMQKTVFLVSSTDFAGLTAVCSGETATRRNDKTDSEKTFDQVYCDELVQYGGFTQNIADKTIHAQGVENKTKVLFEMIELMNNGQNIPRDDDQSQKQAEIVRCDKPTEDTQEIVSLLV